MTFFFHSIASLVEPIQWTHHWNEKPTYCASIPHRPRGQVSHKAPTGPSPHHNDYALAAPLCQVFYTSKDYLAVGQRCIAQSREVFHTVRCRNSRLPGSLQSVFHISALKTLFSCYSQAFARFEITLTMLELERVTSLTASIKACKFVPLPEIITVIRTVLLAIANEQNIRYLTPPQFSKAEYFCGRIARYGCPKAQVPAARTPNSNGPP